MKLKFCRTLAAMLCLSILLCLCGQTVFAEGTEVTDLSHYHTTVESAAGELREQMTLRASPITVYLALDEQSDTVPRELFFGAFAHTGVPNQGDYLKWQCGGCSIDWNYEEQDGMYLYTLTYTVEYYTTAQEEEAVDRAAAELLEELDLEDAGDYRKICTVYDYICQNVTYDHLGVALGDTKVYTAYGALINGRAVCQGNAVLLYRLALALGLDARFVAGISRSAKHAWNIVKLGDRYYNLDSTWDAGAEEYEYFLQCDDSFAKHVREDTYSTAEFCTAYPMADRDYWHIQGDFDESGTVTDEDAIYLLWHTLFKEDYPLSQNGDVDCSGVVTDEDAIYLLWHTLFEEDYPLR